jgi:site-specific DNA recombinase
LGQRKGPVGCYRQLAQRVLGNSWVGGRVTGREREMVIDRVVTGMEREAAKGQWRVSFAPEGYMVDPDSQHLVPVEAEIPTIKEIFRLYTKRRMGCQMVAKTINARGLRRRSGKPYSYKTVADVLSNPAYIGTVLFREVEVDNAHPAIIDKESFDLAQRLLTERGENPAVAAGAASDYHLTGKIKCPLCGHNYVGTQQPANYVATATTPAGPATGTARPLQRPSYRC